jgi:glutathione synthase/RimK-type ligase-like ATP-grasp enzyme
VVREDAAQRLSLELELGRMHTALASLVPAEAWLNVPDAMRAAESKLRQLKLAAEVGFKCPRTLVTNDWERARRSFGSDGVIFKALRGGIRREGEDRVVFTQRLDLDGEAAASGALPYPGLLQAEIERIKEWRVTVVGTRVFPVAVYASSDGVDWRRDQLQGKTRFVHEELDSRIEEACRLIVKKLGLRYAAVDLIEEPAGDFVFLEANPNGQYAWLEKELGLPISTEVARLLETSAATGSASGR